MVRFFCLGITLNALLISSLYAGFFDRTIKVQCGNELYTYEVVKNKIYEKISYKNTRGEIKPLSLDVLDSCTIKDANNWKCGGVRSNTASGRYFTSEEHLVIDGTYSYFPSRYDNIKTEYNCVRKQIT